MISFLARYLIYEALKYFKSFLDHQIISNQRLDQFAENLNFPSYFSSEILKITNSFHRIFQASYLSFEVLKLINSFHRQNQFAKKLRFLNKLFQLWRLSFFPSCFIEEIGSRIFFHARYLSLKQLKKNQLSYVLSRFAKNINYLRELSELFNYDLFEFTS